jgi:hypothetical protein
MVRKLRYYTKYIIGEVQLTRMPDPDPFTFLGWAFMWRNHTSGGSTTQNMNHPRFSKDFTTVREIIYDEWAHYGFYFRVRRTDPYVHLVIKGALLQKDKDPVYLSKSDPEAIVNPKKPYDGFDPAPGPSSTNDEHQVMLYWPMKYGTYHTYGSTPKFQFHIGWRKSSDPITTPPTFAKPLPEISFFISDVITKSPLFG